MYGYTRRSTAHIFDSRWSSHDLHTEARQWCTREFGEGDGNPVYDTSGAVARNGRWLWFNRGARIIIWGEQDAFAFRMRWC